MTKSQFEKKLLKNLKSMSPKEKASVLEYYHELYFDKLEGGETEEQIIAGFGDPKEAAAKVLKEHTNVVDSPSIDDVPKAKTSNSFLNFMKGTLKVMATLLKYIALFALLVASVSLIASGIFLMIGAAVISFKSLSVAAIQAGGGLVILALGLVLGLLFITLFKKVRIWRRLKEPNKTHAKSKKVSKIVLILASTFAVLGFAGALAGFIKIDFDYKKLDTTTYASGSFYAEESQEINSVKINVSSRNVKILPAEENYGVEYFDFDSSKIYVSLEDGKLTITEDYTFVFGWSPFQWIISDKRAVNIYLPQEILENSEITCSSGSIYMQDMSFLANANISAHSGSIKINNCIFNKLKVEASSGSISIANSQIINLETLARSGSISINESSAESLKADVSSGSISIARTKVSTINVTVKSGSIRLNKLTTNSAEFQASSGSISGSIEGTKEEFNLSSSVRSGSSNISNQSGTTEKSLSFKVSSGRIRISFV